MSEPRTRTKYAYDPASNLTAASTSQASATFTYDPRNALRTLSRANGVSTGYVYDPVGRVLSITHSAGATSLSSQMYTYDAVGNRASQTTDIGQPLITAASTNQYDPANEQTQRGSTTNTFDANGNLISESGPSGTTTYAWDSRNRLQSITISGGQTTTFTYDFTGNLVTQKDSGPTLNLTQNFVLDDLTNVAYQSNSDGSQLSVLSGRSIDQHLAVIQSSGAQYGLPDAINSTVATVDETGAMKTKFFYEPFGQTSSPGSTYPFQYTGRVPVSGSLYYYRARYYSPLPGRFISEDPADSSARSNLYRYVGDNPMSYGDPQGLMPQSSGTASCTKYLPCRPDLFAACQSFPYDEYNNCVRACLQQHFGACSYDDPFDAAWGANLHRRCFKECSKQECKVNRSK